MVSSPSGVRISNGYYVQRSGSGTSEEGCGAAFQDARANMVTDTPTTNFVQYHLIESAMEHHTNAPPDPDYFLAAFSESEARYDFTMPTQTVYGTHNAPIVAYVIPNVGSGFNPDETKRVEFDKEAAADDTF